LIDVVAWLGPQHAALQAQSIHAEFVRLPPESTKEFDANLRASQTDLVII
jgi:ABC-type Zn uptake system ZnuABC Zn-binding protein ZnuA